VEQVVPCKGEGGGFEGKGTHIHKQCVAHSNNN
jgi:hypothetical protein